MHPATLKTISHLAAVAKARRSSVPSAERIVGEAGKRLRLDWRHCEPMERVRLLHEVRLVARAWLRREAERAAAVLCPEDVAKGLFGAAKDAATGFFDRAGKFIRNAIVAAGLAFMGPGEPTRIEIEAINQQVAAQHAFLDVFEQEVLEEKKPLVPARAEQYGSSVWGAAQAVGRASMLSYTDIKSEYARHLGKDDPCPDCAQRLYLGTVPVGTLVPIGQTQCRTQCHCIIVYIDANGTEYFVPRRKRGRRRRRR